MNATRMKAWRDLTRRKIRTLLVVLSIAVGVLGITVVLGTGERLSTRLQESYLEANPADIVVITAPLPSDQLAKLEALPGVRAVEGAFVFNTRWQWDGTWYPLIIESRPDLTSREMDIIELVAGEMPEGNGLLVEHTAENILPVAVGAKIVIQTPDGDQELTIRGLGRSATHPPASFSQVAVAFVSLAEAEQILGQTGFNVVRFRLTDIDEAESISEALRDYWQTAGIPLLSVTARDPQDFPGRDGVQSILLLMSLFGVLALLLSGLLVINTITTVLASEIPQIGTMKAIGATRWAVMRVYLTLIMAYGVVGSVIGVALGTLVFNWLSGYIAGLTDVTISGFAFSPLAAVIGLVVGMVIPFAAAWLPIWLGTGITVREAMTSYGLSSRPGPLGRLLARLQVLPFTLSLSLRNVFRSRGRALLTLATLAMAGVAFIAVQATGSSLNRSLDILTDTYNADVLVVLDLPVAREELADLTSGDETVAAVETWLDAPAEVNDQPVTLNGLPVATTLYKKNLAEGRWFREGESEVIIIQEKFARDTHLGVGDEVSVRVGNETLNWEIIGIVRDYNESGQAPLVPYEQLAEVLGWDGLADALLIQAEERSLAAVDALAAALADDLPRLGVQGSVSTMNALREQAQAGFQIIVLFLAGMAVLVGIVGGLGLLGTLTINVTERQREIGVMRSIGASHQAVVQQFWLEGIWLGVLSWGIAAAIGYPVAQWFTRLLSDVLLPIEFYLPPATLLWLGVGMLTVASLASIGPALAAARTKVSDIIRYA
jgi:putative ABC transport system permease protein